MHPDHWLDEAEARQMLRRIHQLSDHNGAIKPTLGPWLN